MVNLWIFTIIFAFNYVRCENAITFNCETPQSGLTAPTFPDITKYTTNEAAYMMQLEVNDRTKVPGNSYFVEEYFDIQTHDARLKMVGNAKENLTYVYLGQTKESYTATGSNCFSIPTINAAIDLGIAYNIKISNYMKNNTIFGPSAIFQYLTAQSQNMQYLGNYNGQLIRGIKVNVWQSCADNSVVKVYFADTSVPNPYGIGSLQFPVRIVTNGNDIANNSTAKRYVVHEISQYQLFTAAQKKQITIPIGYGCQRNASALKLIPYIPPQPKVANNVDVDIQFEIVSTIGFLNSDSIDTAVNVGRMTFDQDSEVMALLYQDWRNVSGVATISNFEYRKIYSIRERAVYNINYYSGRCRIHRVYQNDSMFVNLPLGGQLSLTKSKDLMPGAAGFTYMANITERGVPVIVYEKLVPSMDFGPKLGQRPVVITHYYFRDNYLLTQEKNNMYIKIGLRIYDSPKMSSSKVVTINLYGFSITMNMQTKMKLMDVSSCHLQQGQSKWFRITFPTNMDKSLDLDNTANDVINAFLDYVQENTDLNLMLPPTRIARVIVDYNIERNVVITALLLERPTMDIDFNSPIKGKLITGQYAYNQFVSPNLDICLKNCIEDSDCDVISYCGGFSCVQGKNDSTQGLIQTKVDNSCVMYQKVKSNSNNGPADYSTKTMKTVLAKINDTVNSGAFKFYVNITITDTIGTNLNIQTLRVLLSGATFKSGFQLSGSSIFGNFPKNEDPSNDKYKITRLETHFVGKSPYILSQVNVDSFDQCSSACDDFEGKICHSFSYCKLSHECILSNLHTEDLRNITVKRALKINSNCDLFSRFYIHEYVQIAGVDLPRMARKQIDKIRTEEACAMRCSTETTFKCLSFDMCYNRLAKIPTTTCLLHTVHFLDSNVKKNDPNEKPINWPMNATADNIPCGHYSRNFVADFPMVLSNTKFVSHSGKLKIQSVTLDQCANECARALRSSCISMEFCETYTGTGPPQQTCYLTPVPNKTHVTEKVTDAGNCAIYGMEKMNVKNVYHYNSNASKKTYKRGVAIGVSLFLLVAGAVTVALILRRYMNRTVVV